MFKDTKFIMSLGGEKREFTIHYSITGFSVFTELGGQIIQISEGFFYGKYSVKFVFSHQSSVLLFKSKFESHIQKALIKDNSFWKELLTYLKNKEL